MVDQSIIEKSPTRPARSGFSLRIGGGAGYGSAHGNVGTGHTLLGGFAGAISIDVGAATSERLVIYGRLGGFAFNRAFDHGSSTSSGTYFGLLGGGVRYYLTPDDWYTSGTLAVGAATVSDARNRRQTAHTGLGLEVEVGKDWWSGRADSAWAVGLGARVSYVNCTSSSANDSWEGAAFTLVLSVSYN